MLKRQRLFMLSDLLPTYSVRASKKARYLQLRMRPTGLEVIVPVKMRVSNNDIQQFLLEKKSWIDKYSHVLMQAEVIEAKHTLPDTLFLLGMIEVWQITYCETKAQRVRLKIESSQKIMIEGAISNKISCVTMLKRWIKQKAAIFLQNRLLQLAERVQLPFEIFAVRDMKSRWGSCSSQKKITLCTNLIFLPLHLIDHVLLHELCHTKYMSHGKRFWNLLARFDPDAKQHNHELKKATQFIPSWLLCK